MSYVVALQPAAERQYARLAPAPKASVLRTLRSLEEDPRRRGVRPVKTMPGSLRARAGDYRIIFNVDDAARIVSVVRIAPRDKAYRP